MDDKIMSTSRMLGNFLSDCSHEGKSLSNVSMLQNQNNVSDLSSLINTLSLPKVELNILTEIHLTMLALSNNFSSSLNRKSQTLVSAPYNLCSIVVVRQRIRLTIASYNIHLKNTRGLIPFLNSFMVDHIWWPKA